MTDKLRRIYEAQGALDRYYEGATPIDLYRGRRLGDLTDLFQPTLIGWYARLEPRRPDVLIEDGKGESPQYTAGDHETLVIEERGKPVTAEILRNADKYIVKGCRTMAGHHRGISVFDKTNPGLRALVGTSCRR